MQCTLILIKSFIHN